MTGSTERREIISRNKTDSGCSTLIPPNTCFAFFLQEIQNLKLCPAADSRENRRS